MKLFRCTFINAVRELKSALSAQVGFNSNSIEIAENANICVIVNTEGKTIIVPLGNIISAEVESEALVQPEQPVQSNHGVKILPHKQVGAKVDKRKRED
jgi:hypothetical protein